MKIDIHVHTSVVSNGTMRPEDLIQYVGRTKLVERAREQGVDGICITEHDRVWPAEVIRATREEFGFPILSGMEVSTNYADYGHVLVFGFESYVSGIWDINKLARVCRDQDAMMIVAHPFRELLFPRYPSGTVLSVEEALQWPIFQLVQGIEVFNGATLDRENRFAAEVCGRLGLKGTGGSDAHSATGLGNGITLFEREIHDEEGLLTELKAGRFKAATRQRHIGYREWPEGERDG